MKDFNIYDKWTLHELKPIHMLLRKYKHTFDSSGFGHGGYDFRGQGWTINETMVKKFGDGSEHRFFRIHEGEEYTHRGEDGYYYSEKWFKDSRPIIEFNEEEFLI